MKLEEILQMTNEKGQRFVNMWLKSNTFLGTERRSDDISREEFTVIYRTKDGSVMTVVLPNAGTVNDGSCFFGCLQYFAAHYAADKAGVRLYYGCLQIPRPYPADDEKLKVYNQAYNEIMNKYNPQNS